MTNHHVKYMDLNWYVRFGHVRVCFCLFHHIVCYFQFSFKIVCYNCQHFTLIRISVGIRKARFLSPPVLMHLCRAFCPSVQVHVIRKNSLVYRKKY